jgi:hypothetical protein
MGTFYRLGPNLDLHLPGKVFVLGFKHIKEDAFGE